MYTRANAQRAENNRRFYSPNGGASKQSTPPSPPPPPPKRHGADTDSMQLDDSKDRVYIYNLDDELSGTESDEEKLIFLPDVEKRLAKIPKSVLTSSIPPATSNEIVLYNVPQSLSVPEEQDSVRKAIIETRARAREQAAAAAAAAGAPAPAAGAKIAHTNGIHNPQNGSLGWFDDINLTPDVPAEVDADAMDLG